MTENFDKERAHRTFYKIIQTDRLHRNVLEGFLSSLGIHRSQHMILMYLSHNENCQSQKAIAEHFGISAAAVAVTLKKLEEMGYVFRQTVEKDSRYNSITLSEKGKTIVLKSKQLFEETDHAMFSEFSDEDYEQLNRCLDKMKNGLEEYRLYEEQKNTTNKT